MSFPDAVRHVLSNYVTFNRRARRSEYWWFFLFIFLSALAAAIVDGALGTYPLLYLLVVLALFLPSLAVGVRRLHDTGRSGWWTLIGFVPLVGSIILIVLNCGDSQPDYQYGPNPQGLGMAPGAPGLPYA